MRFWDTSALLPILLDEPATPVARALLAQDPGVCVWSLTEVEAYSALRRRTRATPPLDVSAFEIARARLDRLAATWRIVPDLISVHGHARRLLDVHALKAADALQLAAAWVFHDGAIAGKPFVSFDALLAQAAASEGFRVSTVDASGQLRRL